MPCSPAAVELQARRAFGVVAEIAETVSASPNGSQGAGQFARGNRGSVPRRACGAAPPANGQTLMPPRTETLLRCSLQWVGAGSTTVWNRSSGQGRVVMLGAPVLVISAAALVEATATARWSSRQHGRQHCPRQACSMLAGSSTRAVAVASTKRCCADNQHRGSQHNDSPPDHLTCSRRWSSRHRPDCSEQRRQRFGSRRHKSLAVGRRCCSTRAAGTEPRLPRANWPAPWLPFGLAETVRLFPPPPQTPSACSSTAAGEHGIGLASDGAGGGGLIAVIAT